MKNLTLVIFSLLLYGTLYAQTNRWVVKSGENIDNSLPADVKFLYPHFTAGNVFFRDGTQSAALLDYNLLNEEMQFIAPTGDTLTVDNEATISYIVIGSDTFFYDKIFIKLVAGNAIAKLAKKEALGITDVKKGGGYDQFSSTSSITTVKSVSLQDRITNLTQKQEIVLIKATTYYISDKYNHFVPANKKNILKLFGKKQNAIDQYLKDNKVFFNKEEDLVALIDFLKNQ